MSQFKKELREQHPPRRRLTEEQALLAVCSITALFVVFAFLRQCQSRLNVSSTLEMNESVCFELTQRVSENFPLFPPPSAEFISSCYPPLFPVLCSMVSIALPREIGFMPLRALSLSSTGLIIIVTF